MHRYLVICLIKTIFIILSNAMYNIIKDFRIQLTINFLWMIIVKTVIWTLGMIRIKQLFIYMAALDPPHLVLPFYLLNWTKIIQICHSIYLLTTFRLLGKLFLVLERLRLTNFIKFYLNYQSALIFFLPREQLNKNWKVLMTALTPCKLACSLKRPVP